MCYAAVTLNFSMALLSVFISLFFAGDDLMKMLNFKELLLVSGGCEEADNIAVENNATEETIEIAVVTPELSYATFSFAKLSLGCCK